MYFKKQVSNLTSHGPTQVSQLTEPCRVGAQERRDETPGCLISSFLYTCLVISLSPPPLPLFLFLSRSLSLSLGCWVQGLGRACLTLVLLGLGAVCAACREFGFRVQGSGFRVQGSGFRVQGSGFRVQGSGFKVLGSWFKVQDPGFRVQVSGFGARFRIQGSSRRLPAGRVA